jgi:hypothetical protein
MQVLRTRQRPMCSKATYFTLPKDQKVYLAGKVPSIADFRRVLCRIVGLPDVYSSEDSFLLLLQRTLTFLRTSYNTTIPQDEQTWIGTIPTLRELRLRICAVCEFDPGLAEEMYLHSFLANLVVRTRSIQMTIKKQSLQEEAYQLLSQLTRPQLIEVLKKLQKQKG